MAADGMLPRIFAKHTKRNVPWVSLVACAAAWAACSGISFERLIELDILLYGLSLILEFAALLALRVREPNLARPFRIPGGLGVAALLSAMPTAIILWALYAARGERVSFSGHSAPVLVMGVCVIALGIAIDLVQRKFISMPTSSSLR
jgi:amino acid transporter